MSFKLFTALLGFTVLLLFFILRFFKGEVKIFIKKTNYYLLGAMLCFALFGLTGLLLRTPQSMDASTLAILFQLWCLGLGILHYYLLFNILPWANPDLTWREWVFSLLVMATGSLAFFQVCIYFEKVNRQLPKSYADDLLPGIVLFLLPMLLRKAYDMWLTIPQISVTGWTLPLDARPRPIEPGKSVKLTFLIPVRHGSDEIIQIDMLAPSERTLGETFHYILYRHNVEKNSYKKIEVAENNSRERLYNWLFLTRAKQWWWFSKRYINADYKIRQLNFRNGEVIHVERLKHW